MDTISVGELLDQWFQVKRHSMATTTRHTTAGAIRYMQADPIGLLTVDAIKVRHVERWYADMISRGYSVAYAKRLAGVCSAAYSHALRWELADQNPWRSAEKPRNRKRVLPPTTDTVKQALTYARKHDFPLYVFIRLDAVTGARRSELLAIDRTTFDPDLQQLTIRRVYVPGEDGATIVDQTKSERGARTISLDLETCELLQKQFASHESVWLFPGRNATNPIYPTTISHKVKKLGDKLGARLHPHGLRHYVATELLQRGVPINVVAARLGDTVATVMKVYAHSIAADDRHVADLIADGLA